MLAVECKCHVWRSRRLRRGFSRKSAGVLSLRNRDDGVDPRLEGHRGDYISPRIDRFLNTQPASLCALHPFPRRSDRIKRSTAREWSPCQRSAQLVLSRPIMAARTYSCTSPQLSAPAWIRCGKGRKSNRQEDREDCRQVAARVDGDAFRLPADSAARVASLNGSLAGSATPADLWSGTNEEIV